MDKKQRPKNYSPELRARAVRMVFEHQDQCPNRWEAIKAIAGKIGCHSDSLRKWVKQKEIDQGTTAGVSSEERRRIKELEREVKELRQANEILKKASAYFAMAELVL